MTKIVDGIITEFDSGIQEFLDLSSNLLDELVLYGLYLINLIYPEDGKLPVVKTRIPLLILRDMLENLDSASILLRRGCSFGTIPVLRVALEQYLCFMFMLDGEIERKAITYEVCHIHEQIKAGESIKQRDGTDVEASIQRLKTKLEHPAYAEASKKLEEYKQKRGYLPKWYNISEPRCKSLATLAKQIKKEELYNVVCGAYSKYAHGTLALINQGQEEEYLRFSPLRKPHLVSSLCWICLNITSDSYYKFIDNFLNDDDKGHFEAWYRERVVEKGIIRSREALIFKQH